MNVSISRLLPALCVSGLLFTAQPLLATNYSGNGASGFGGVVGSSTLTVSNSGPNTGSGIISFVFNAGAAFGNDDDLVFYIDSVAGGFNSTSTFADNTDGGHIAISGEDTSNAGDSGASTQDIATFAPGFLADYALVLDPTDSFAGLYLLGSGGNGTIVYQEGANYSNPSTNVYDFSLLASNLGLTGTAGSKFNFVGTLISQTAYRSNETIGASATTPDTGAAPNGGFDGSQTFSNSDTFTFAAIPEPTSIGLLVCGGVAALVMRKRRG